MCCRGIQRQMAVHFHKGHVHLQRRIGQRPKKLQLRILFDRHKIQNTDLQWADILVHRTIFVHHENIFIIQNLSGRQITLYFNRHFLSHFPAAVRRFF